MMSPARPPTRLPVLYSFRRCPFAMRARLALSAAGQRVELREVLLRDKPAAMLAASAKATVPVLVLTDGQVVDESLQIMLWALGRHDPDHWLTPDGGSLAAMLSLIGECDGSFKTALDHYKYPSRYRQDDPGSDPMSHRDDGAQFLASLQQRLGQSANLNLYGPRFSLADAAIAPFVRQFAMTDQAWFDSQPWPALQQWLKRFLASGRFAKIMVRQQAWQP